MWPQRVFGKKDKDSCQSPGHDTGGGGGCNRDGNDDVKRQHRWWYNENPHRVWLHCGLQKNSNHTENCNTSFGFSSENYWGTNISWKTPFLNQHFRFVFWEKFWKTPNHSSREITRPWQEGSARKSNSLQCLQNTPSTDNAKSIHGRKWRKKSTRILRSCSVKKLHSQVQKQVTYLFLFFHNLHFERFVLFWSGSLMSNEVRWRHMFCQILERVEIRDK